MNANKLSLKIFFPLHKCYILYRKPTVGAKSIICAKRITRYDINGLNISKFFNFLLFSFFYSLLI
jgi:hypothetical protein